MGRKSIILFRTHDLSFGAILWLGNAIPTRPDIYTLGSLDRSSARSRNTTIRPSVHLTVHIRYYGEPRLEHDASGIQIASMCEQGGVVVEDKESIATNGCT